MEGVERSFRKWIKSTLTGRFEFNYLEIGIGYGQTLAAVSEILSGIEGLSWRAYGIEKATGWSYNPNTVESNVAEFGERVQIILKPSEDGLVGWSIPLNFALIDGCHEKDCCTADFLLVEPHITAGGVVAFHDSGAREQGSSIQPHKGEPIRVRASLQELGLLNRTRDGWSILEDCQPPDNSGCFFVRKT
jgi:hypothetical protein